jgi:tripartite-type tricarboxylate transporter receptor subunit TctC
MTPIPIAQPHLAAGTLVALGVSGARRSRLLPDVPTIAEAGVSGFDFPIWYGTWAPRTTPPPIVNELSTGIAAALNVPELLTWFAEHEAEPMNLTQPEFANFVERERDRAASIARAAGIAKA